MQGTSWDKLDINTLKAKFIKGSRNKTYSLFHYGVAFYYTLSITQLLHFLFYFYLLFN